jgi:WD40 repeat protein
MCDETPLMGRTISAITWSPDSSKLAVASFAVDSLDCFRDMQVQVWDSGTNVELIAIPLDTPVWALDWHPNSFQLAIADGRGELQIWDVNTAQLMVTTQIAEGAILELDWSPDGSQLLSSGWDNVIRISSPAGQVTSSIRLETSDYPGLSSGIGWLAWSPSGNSIASAGVDGILRIWNPANFQLLASLQGHTSAPIIGSWSPDGQKIATGGYDNNIQVWDVSTGQSLFQLRGHSDYISSLSWSPDGTQIASASGDGTVRIWDVATGTLVTFMRTSAYSILLLDWSSDNRLAFGGKVTFEYDEDFQLVDSGLPLVAPFDPNFPPLIIESSEPPNSGTPSTSQNTPTPVQRTNGIAKLCPNLSGYLIPRHVMGHGYVEKWSKMPSKMTTFHLHSMLCC